MQWWIVSLRFGDALVNYGHLDEAVCSKLCSWTNSNGYSVFDIDIANAESRRSFSIPENSIFEVVYRSIFLDGRNIAATMQLEEVLSSSNRLGLALILRTIRLVRDVEEEMDIKIVDLYGLRCWWCRFPFLCSIIRWQSNQSTTQISLRREAPLPRQVPELSISNEISESCTLAGRSAKSGISLR